MAGQPSLMHVVFVHGDSGVGIRVEKELTTHPEVWERHSGVGLGLGRNPRTWRSAVGERCFCGSGGSGRHRGATGPWRSCQELSQHVSPQKDPDDKFSRPHPGGMGSDDIVEMSQRCPELSSVTFTTDPPSGPVVLRGEWWVGQPWVTFQETRALRLPGEVLSLPSMDFSVFSRKWGRQEEPQILA